MAVAVDIAGSCNLSSEEIPNGPPEGLLHVSFNQDGGCFAAGTTSGFRIYNCDPFSEIFRRRKNFRAPGGGVGTLEMLFRTNVLALIRGGGNPRASRLMIWDDSKRRFLGVVTPGPGSLLRGVRIALDYVVAVTDPGVSVYSFPDLALRYRYATSPNARGVCALTPVGPGRVLACPGPRAGQVRVERLHLAPGDARRTVLVDAHPSESALECLALSPDGRLVAAACAGGAAGAVVRVFDAAAAAAAADGKLLREFSLGADALEVHSLAFSGDARFLAAAGDGGAVRVFGLQAEGQDGAASRFRTGDGERCIVAFGAQSDTVMIVSMGGSFCRCRFDPVHGGEMKLLERRDFMSPSNLST